MYDNMTAFQGQVSGLQNGDLGFCPCEQNHVSSHNHNNLIAIISEPKETLKGWYDQGMSYLYKIHCSKEIQSLIANGLGMRGVIPTHPPDYSYPISPWLFL